MTAAWLSRSYSVRDLRTYFYTESGVARSVDGVSFDIAAGETVGLVGESGCGKSVTALSLLRLIRPPGRIEAGSEIPFDGHNLVTLDEKSMRAIRGARMSMVFQEPMTALNPVFKIGDQIAEVVRVHDGGTEARGVGSRGQNARDGRHSRRAAERVDDYPHQLSGGMRQRVVIAMALVMNPALVIADEPTTALDVTIQAQILELLRELQQKFGTSILLITHDLGVVAETVSRVIVMYGGEIVEQAPVNELFAAAHHPYTEGLLARDAAGRAGARAARDDSRLRPAADGVADGLSLSRPLPVRVGSLRNRASAALSDRRRTRLALSSRRRAAATRRRARATRREGGARDERPSRRAEPERAVGLGPRSGEAFSDQERAIRKAGRVRARRRRRLVRRDARRDARPRRRIGLRQSRRPAA